MNKVDSYHFGEIVINGKKYSSDVVIFPDKVGDNWWRKTGHQLCVEDIAEVEQATQAQGIKLIVETTTKACNTYNQLSHSQKVVATLHLTC